MTIINLLNFTHKLNLSIFKLHEGGHIKLSCVSDARPAEEVKLSWSWDGEPNRMELIDSQVRVE